MNSVNESPKARERNPRGEGERLREALIETAIELLAEHEDADQVTVRAVTARAGVSPTALYLHFENRLELMRAVSEGCFAELGASQREAAAAAGPDPRVRLVALGHAYLRFARERPGHYAVLFERHLPRHPDDLDENGQPTVGMDVFGTLVEAVRSCGVPEETAFDSSVLLWMALHGRAAVASAMPGFPFADEDSYVELLAERVVGPA